MIVISRHGVPARESCWFKTIVHKTGLTIVYYSIFPQQGTTLRRFLKTSRHSHPPREEPCINLGKGGTDHILGQLSVRPCYSGSPDSSPSPRLPSPPPPHSQPRKESGWPTHAILALAAPKPRKGHHKLRVKTPIGAQLHLSVTPPTHPPTPPIPSFPLLCCLDYTFASHYFCYSKFSTSEHYQLCTRITVGPALATGHKGRLWVWIIQPRSCRVPLTSDTGGKVLPLMYGSRHNLTRA